MWARKPSKPVNCAAGPWNTAAMSHDYNMEDIPNE